jgi:hypothetical protein
MSPAPGEEHDAKADARRGFVDRDRWQYVVANIGTFGTGSRLPLVLAHLGEQGYELVTVYDKASNWMNGWEKGFMLFKRLVPAGTEPDGPWCDELDTSRLRGGGYAPDEYARNGYPEGQAW